MNPILMTILTYMGLRSIWQADAMRDSQELQDQQMQTSNEQTQVMQAQTREEALVQSELDDSEDVTTEQYTQVLQKMSEIAAKFETKLRAILSKCEAAEREIQQRITAREPKLKAIDADIEGLEEVCEKRTEEQFDYGMMVS